MDVCAADLSAWRRELLLGLREDAGEPESDAAAATAFSGRVEVLAFRLGAEKYAVELRDVLEILMPRNLAPVPRAGDVVKGVASVRGAVLAVLDLARRLGFEPAQPTKTARILVLRDGDEQLGFWVDEVHGVVRFVEDQMEVSGFAAAVDPRFVRGIGYDRSGALVAVLSAEQLCEFSVEEG